MNATVHHVVFGSNCPIPARADRDWVTSTELIAEAGITYRQLDYWIRTGHLVHIDDGLTQSGHLRRYAEHQVDRAAATRELLEAGVSLQTIRRVIDQFTATGHVDLGHITLTRNTTKEHDHS